MRVGDAPLMNEVVGEISSSQVKGRELSEADFAFRKLYACKVFD